MFLTRAQAECFLYNARAFDDDAYVDYWESDKKYVDYTTKRVRDWCQTYKLLTRLRRCADWNCRVDGRRNPAGVLTRPAILRRDGDG